MLDLNKMNENNKRREVIVAYSTDEEAHVPSVTYYGMDFKDAAYVLMCAAAKVLAEEIGLDRENLANALLIASMRTMANEIGGSI